MQRKRKCKATKSGSVWSSESRYHYSTAPVIQKEGKNRHSEKTRKGYLQRDSERNKIVRFKETLGEITDFIARKHKGLFF